MKRGGNPKGTKGLTRLQEKKGRWGGSSSREGFPQHLGEGWSVETFPSTINLIGEGLGEKRARRPFKRGKQRRDGELSV